MNVTEIDQVIKLVCKTIALMIGLYNIWAKSGDSDKGLMWLFICMAY